MMIPKATKEESERIRKELMEIPCIIPPTGKKGPCVFDPVEIRDEPLSSTVIKARR